ncbi:hypothetical protein HK098_007571 [Nowakowskiella sp. JEL0407]|nr:hypothetical protein HK098_007571 [Nowakowskiella sp. JEL0407]
MARWIIVLLLWLQSARALFQDQAASWDWHSLLVGTPSLLLQPHSAQLRVATAKNLLASVSAKSGNIAWRVRLDPDDKIRFIAAPSDSSLLSISGSESITTRLWDASSGFLLWESPDLVTLPTNSTSDTISAVKVPGGIVTLIGNRVSKLGAKDGKRLWDYVSDSTLAHVAAVDKSVYVITKSLIVSKLSAKTGEVDTTYTLESPVGDSIIVSDEFKNLFLVWFNNDAQVLIHKLGSAPDHIENFNTDYHDKGIKLQKVFESGYPQFTVTTQSGQSVLVRLSETGTPIMNKLRNVNGNWLISGAILDGKPYYATVITSQGESLGQFADSSTGEVITKFTLPHNSDITGDITKIKLDVYKKKDGSGVGYRILTVTEDGSMHMLRESQVLWSREESLTQISDAKFIDLPESRGFSEDHDELNELLSQTEALNPVSRYIRRIQIHLSKLSTLPSTLFEPKSKPDNTNSTSDVIIRDAFGVKKIILVATKTGKLVAMETLKGKIVWSKYFEDGVEKVEVVRSVVVKQPPLVVLVFRRDKSTVLKTINPLTGKSIGKETVIPKRFIKVVKLSVLDPVEHSNVLAVIDEEEKLWLHPSTSEVHSEFAKRQGTVYFYIPDAVGGNTVRGFTVVPARENVPEFYELKQNWKFTAPNGEEFAALGDKPKDEKIPSIGRVLGNRKVLYKYLNPNILTIATVKETADPKTSVLNIYLLDTVSGAILHHASHGAGGYIHGKTGVHLLQSENWVVYSYFNHGPERSVGQNASGASGSGLGSGEEEEEEKGEIEDEIEREKERVKRRRMKKVKKEEEKQGGQEVPEVKGVEVVVLELFEDSRPDKRVESTYFSSFNGKKPYVLSQAYVFPEKIGALGTTSTRHGITVREVLFGLGSSILGVPKRILDPRRPTVALTADDKEEMLVPYKAAIEYNEKDVATYYLEIIGTEKIISSPAILESTSLVLSYGVDLFFTRRMPSKTFDLLNDDFNYASLIGTMIILVVGIFVVRHFVIQKKLNDSWK